MKRVSNNIKFYTFIEILKSYSDENVSLSIKEIQHHMRKQLGVDVDRRTIYAYIRDMKALGIDVSDYDKSKEGYYINSNCFEASEVRLLADAVLTSNFVTRRISEAIKFSRKIRFNYCEYNYFRELECKVDENGNLREFVKSPVYMVLRDKNYYLVCADEDSEVFQYFRIDMMLNVFVIEDERIIDLSELGDCRSADCKNTSDFSQFTSRSVSIDNNVNIFPRRANIVMVEFKKNLMESLLDEFGDYIYIMEKDNYRNNNLEEDLMNNYNSLRCVIKRGHLEAQILEKIFGKLDYEKYVLSGKYIENSLIREKLRGFSNALNMIICDDYDKKVDMFSEIDKDEDENKDKDKNGDKDKNKNKDKDENEKSYIGIFVEKECGYLSKNIMQFGAGMKVVWPDNVKNEVVNRLKGMLSLYE
ncbi:WYL domain-containing protein [Intestinibacter bartlettii]|uniref:WYL domain-containing protein n=1 Tax=Intestinibacter bartlettii TaxID=261299 RepID=UPI00403D8BF6